MEPYPTDPARYPELARAALFRDLPTSLVAWLSAAERVEDHTIAARLKAIFPIEASGIAGPAGRQPEGYWWKLTSKRERVRGFMESTSMEGDERPSTLFVRASFTEPESTTPKWDHQIDIGFRVPWRPARGVIAQLASKRYYSMALVSDDGAYGFAVSSYVGYLPKEYDNDEIVYRVARWRPRT